MAECLFQQVTARIVPSAVALTQATRALPVDLPMSFEGGLTSLGYSLDRSTLALGETAYLETVWRIDVAPSKLLSQMAYALGSDGHALVVGDGFSVLIES